MFHYLEDGSTRVSEKRVENSGIVTGEIARRHRVPKKEGGYYTVEDFDVGTEIEIFGRAYHITDVDDFTREFYDLNGMPRGDAKDMPPGRNSCQKFSSAVLCFCTEKTIGH